MFDGALSVQLVDEPLKMRYPKASVMRGGEHTVSLFFKDLSKIAVVNQVITALKAIYNLFASGIYFKPHFKFKSKSWEFHNGNIGLFSGNDIKIDNYFI